MVTKYQQRIDEIQGRLKSQLARYVSETPPSLHAKNHRAMLTTGIKLRGVVKDMPLLNVAANVYQELSSTREWTVSGKPNPVAKTVEDLNNARVWDWTTGMYQSGFTNYLKNRSYDYITIGMNAFGVRAKKKGVGVAIDYLDPAVLFAPKDYTKRDKKENILPIEPDTLFWSYGKNNSDPDWRWGEVRRNFAIPYGYDGFVSPTLLVYPTAQIAWFLGEYDRAKIDGRKIREIIITNKGLAEPILTAVEMILSALSGETDITKVGVPIVEASQTMNGPLQDQIAHLGLSQIPDSFVRAEFDHMYANLIAGAYGLALRQFWQDDSNTNRALEEVQEARQQLKGPLAFVRAEQRMINESEIVRVHAPTSRACRFEFLEESDTSSLKDRATALNLFAQALKNVAEAVGARLKPQYLLQQAQNLELLPLDVPIDEMLMTAEEVVAAMEMEQAQVDSEASSEVAQSPDRRTNRTEEVEQNVKRLQKAMANYNAMRKAYRNPDLDEEDIKMDSHGRIVERYVPVFATAKFLEKQLGAVSHNEEKLDANETLRYPESNLDGPSDTEPTLFDKVLADL